MIQMHSVHCAANRFQNVPWARIKNWEKGLAMNKFWTNPAQAFTLDNIWLNYRYMAHMIDNLIVKLFGWPVHLSQLFMKIQILCSFLISLYTFNTKYTQCSHDFNSHFYKWPSLSNTAHFSCHWSHQNWN